MARFLPAPPVSYSDLNTVCCNLAFQDTSMHEPVRGLEKIPGNTTENRGMLQLILAKSALQSEVRLQLR